MMTPSLENPYKWYKISAAASFKGIDVNEFYICIYQYKITYMPMQSIAWFALFFNIEAAIEDFQKNSIEVWTNSFDKIIFEVDKDNTIGITQDINQYLVDKYQIDISLVTE